MTRKSVYVLRMLKKGCTNRPFFIITASYAPKNSPEIKDIEQLGTYDPMTNKYGEKLTALNYDRIKNWICKGAIPTKPVARLLGLSGFTSIHPTTRLASYLHEVNLD
ncbi:hypothetical protein SNEBB_004456 [Seison nebaliae]|nr:hypothetical protein SNEBB_004456 [Seison nebaliae]